MELIMMRAELTISGLSLRGWGQTEIIVGDRPVRVEVRGALPGDRVLAEYRRIEQGGLEAEIVEYLDYGYPRVEPRCPHTGRRCDKDTGCGGCPLQTFCEPRREWPRRPRGARRARSPWRTGGSAPARGSAR